MKRPIEFRGKKVRASNDDQSFAYGHYTEGSPGIHYITKPDGACFRVIPETVGEFTGLLDKNGSRIYEGDIVMVANNDPETNTQSVLQTVEWISHKGGFEFSKISTGCLSGRFLCENNQEHFEVIGNIHEPNGN